MHVHLSYDVPKVHLRARQRDPVYAIGTRRGRFRIDGAMHYAMTTVTEEASIEAVITGLGILLGSALLA